ncbi:DUF4352 domain-containing protein [Arthrobacter sp. H35-D1]|uniref:DUF4352 domain-containing protein n=1 Tax=Arthrobacter sp. H35-D1 TaxID=3046202 RepID=UPI0024BA9F23|nr:DUF4352 domain-containing protein [Arthrobacter sp. H35-D1]MDJ0315065.1 DUF4352 domain-containing protein [Arthrobacter sp. H35-D1]
MVPLTNGSSSPDDSPAGAGHEQSTAALAVETKPATQTTFAIGQPVQSKKFEYVVTGYECGIPSLGQYEVTKEIAKGHFCQLSITAANIANKAERLDFDDFKLLSGEIEYSTDSWVNIKASNDDESSGFLDKINPGLKVKGSIYFDVPTDKTPNVVTIKDTLFGKSATINLK